MMTRYKLLQEIYNNHNDLFYKLPEEERDYFWAVVYDKTGKYDKEK